MTSWSEPSLAEGLAGESPEVVRKDLPEIEIVGGPGRLTRDSLRELWLFREVLLAFAVRTIKVTYKQAAIGIGWALIRPLLAALLFTVFLHKVAKVGGEKPYFLFALAGTSAWTYFNGAASSAMESLVGNSPILRKVYFPREVLPLAAVVAALVDLAIQLGILVIAAILYGRYPNVTWLAVPLPLLLLVLAAAALGIAVSGLNVYYRDVRYALPFVLQLGLFASPVVYPLSKVPDGWRTPYSIFNPIAAAIDSIRRPLLHHAWPQWEILAGATGWTLLLFVLGYILFKRLERDFADRV